jgi:hypothetical protein
MKRVLAIVCLSGCLLGGCFDDTGGTTSGGTTSAGGFGVPTLEATVGGVHSGPSAPDNGSYVDLVNEYDSNGQLSRSTLQIVASSATANASCSLAADRYGTFVTSFGVGQYMLSGASTNGTDSGIAEALGSPTVTTAQGSFSCSGSDCDSVLVNLSWIDAGHTEGFFSGTLLSTGGSADVVCSFYLPTRTFSP